MIFLNRYIGKEVTIDLDTFFYFFVRPYDEVPENENPGITLDSVRERLIRMSPRLTKAHAYKAVFYRRSSKDHVHVRIHFNEEITVLDAFMIRAFMLDDKTRLELDLARYLKTDDLHEMNRCFDEKCEKDGMHYAGPWIPIECNRSDFPLDAQRDYYAYMPRWVKFLKCLANKRGKKSKGQGVLDQT
jgi:hypothetical protein